MSGPKPRHARPSLAGLRVLAIAVLMAVLLAIATMAMADAPSGNSGHFNNGDTQCQNSPSNPNCPPLGSK
jgi:hypothetical protein